MWQSDRHGSGAGGQLTVDVRSLLLDQLAIGWALFEYHAAALTDEDLFWSPSAHQWTMRRIDGEWRPDLADVEPDPVPVTTAAWLTWHIGWWWGTATAHLTQGPVPGHAGWPGDAASAVRRLGRIHDEWRHALTSTDRLPEESAYPWPAGSGKTVADMAAWVNVELTKNAAELGQLLILRRAGRG